MTKVTTWLTSAINWIVTVGGKIAAYLILVITLFTTWDVFSRFALGHGTMWAIEYTGYLMVAVIFFGLAYTERAGDHIVVDFITTRLSKKAQHYITLGGKIVFLFFSIALGYFGWHSFLTSLRLHTTSRTAIDVLVWPYQLFIPIGLAITSLILIVEIVVLFQKDLSAKKDESGDVMGRV